MDRPRIIVEGNIPFVRGCLEDVGCEVSYLAAADITREAAMQADAILTRTRTRCDATLLEGTPVQIVATATIGTDHIDLSYCRKHGIEVANAPGCNAPAVAQYVLSSVARLSNRPLTQLTLGIVGAGHVGTIIERWARALDMRVLVNDPPREAAEGGDGWSTLDDIARECDVVTVHTPYTSDGDYPTVNLLGTDFFRKLRRHPIIINAARGGIVDEDALLAALEDGRVSAAVIDCWKCEPAINPRLLEAATIATPHIAGYSRQGKIRATAMALEAVCRHFGLAKAVPDSETATECAWTVSVRGVADSYDPFADTAMLKGAADTASAFENLRNHYELRPEAPDTPIS